MVAPWQETQFKVVIEFQKSNAGGRRVMKLSHRPDVVPPQLYGRVAPEVWGQFMSEVVQLSTQHPYTSAYTAEQIGYNCGGLLCCLVLGCGPAAPDGGDYPTWISQVQACIQRYAPAFGAGGCNLTLQQVHGNYYIQCDINPAMAVGYAVPAPAPIAYGPKPEQQPAYYPQQQPYQQQQAY